MLSRLKNEIWWSTYDQLESTQCLVNLYIEKLDAITIQLFCYNIKTIE